MTKGIPMAEWNSPGHPATRPPQAVSGIRHLSRCWPATIAAAVLASSPLPATAALIGILPATPGGTDYQAYYDDIIDVTFLADANYASSNNFNITTIDMGGITGGVETYSTMTMWLAEMNSANGGAGHLGASGWRFPYTPTADPGCSDQITSPYVASWGFGCTGGELAHLYFTYDITTTNEGPFVNIERDSSSTSGYWSSEISDAYNVSYQFRFGTGQLVPSTQTTGGFSYTWPVHDGNISVVPLPGAVWFLATAIAGLMGYSRRPWR